MRGDNEMYTKKDLQIIHALKETTNRIKVRAKEIHSEQPKRLGDLSKWDSQHLITLDTILTFWAIDGLLRLMGMVNESENPDPDLWAIVDETLNLLIGFKREDVAKLYLQSGDAQSIIIFLTVYIDRFATSQEIRKRIVAKEIGKRFLEWRNLNSDKTADDLINIILGKESSWYKKMGLPQKAPSGLSFISIEKLSLKRMNETLSEALKNKGDAFIFASDLYENLRGAIEHGDLGSIPYTIIKGVCPVHPKWEMEAPGILKEMIKDTLNEYLPVVSGEMEKTPLAHIDEKRNIERQETKRLEHEIPVDKKTLEAIPDETGKYRDFDLQTQRIMRRIEPLIKMNTKNGSKIKKALERWLSENKTRNQVCKEGGLHPSVLSKFFKNPKVIRIVTELLLTED
jgi:hypothetical protein